MIDEAVGRLSAATGLWFQYVGDTGHVPRFGAPLPPGQHGFHPDGFDVIIGLAHPQLTDEVDGGTIGMTQTAYAYTSANDTQYEWATVVVDMDVLGGDTNEWLRGDSAGPVLMHELGHLAGIDHVNDPGQVMYPVARDDGPTTYGAGDLDGLWRVSAWNGCLPFSPFLSRT